ncbi:indolepyruvate ferredoxin oxidoreductase subunit alpha [Desulfoluna spongiiphila]|uniref:indolepyruvate ferredoxin oxidoreductase subunit alpha n=1 Tax=Desulfoluna spongiiphila TaxID=419481 RepID=UPI0012522915|nr:4Fe-4S binding protein [Desulfoluna spongiiphila]VVS94183.1 twin-arginine translocation pathway signal sequence [Desulfoluna spongiiphila]
MISRRKFVKLSLVALASAGIPLAIGTRKTDAACDYDCSCNSCRKYFVGESCISCLACISICPVAAISEGDMQAIIDEEMCIGCGDCYDICPVEAIACSEEQDDCIDPHGDKDGDGLTNSEECEFGSDPCLRDTDGDGLTDLQEYQIYSFPRRRDTDNDGFDDKIEYLLGTDLRDRNSKPSALGTHYSYDALGRINHIVNLK